MRNRIDLIAAIVAFVYTIIAIVLGEMGIVNLGDYIAQPQITGPFAMAALARFYKDNKVEKTGE